MIVAENQSGVPVAFMGIDEQKLEMLFIDPKERGHGLGKKLVEYGIKLFGLKFVNFIYCDIVLQQIKK